MAVCVPIVNPSKDPKLGKVACERLLLCVAEKDLVRDRGLFYKELLEKIIEANELHIF